MTNKTPDKHQIVLLSMVVAGVIMAGIGLITLRQSNIIVAIALFVAAFAYWRKNNPTR